MKKAIKRSATNILGKDLFEYLKIWYEINIESKYLPLNNSFWSKPLFVHIPKTAGNSIHKTVEVSSAMGHKSIRFYQNKLSDEKKMPFSFTVIRNPYERICSSFYYLKSGGNSLYDKFWADKYLHSYNDINGFVKNGLHEEKISSYFHFLPQLYFITDKGGDIAVDFILRLENLNDDWKRLAKRLNFTAELPQKNVMGGGSKTPLLTHTSRQIIYEFYKDDFLKLGYNKTLNAKHRRK